MSDARVVAELMKQIHICSSNSGRIVAPILLLAMGLASCASRPPADPGDRTPMVFWARFDPSFDDAVTAVFVLDPDRGSLMVQSTYGPETSPYVDIGGRFCEGPARVQIVSLSDAQVQTLLAGLGDLWQRPPPEYEESGLLDGIYVRYGFQRPGGEYVTRLSHSPDKGTREHAITELVLKFARSLPLEPGLAKEFRDLESYFDLQIEESLD